MFFMLGEKNAGFVTVVVFDKKENIVNAERLTLKTVIWYCKSDKKTEEKTVYRWNHDEKEWILLIKNKVFLKI